MIVDRKGFIPRATFSQNKSGAGFTVIELVVSIAIIILVGGLVFTSFKSSEKTLNLERSAQKLAQDIKRAAGFAVYSQQDIYCGAKDLSGYGLYFNQGDDFYILYANCNGADKEGYNVNQDAIVETIELEEEVKILATSTGVDWSVAFFPPNPRAALCAVDKCDKNEEVLSAASTTLSLKNNENQIKIINVNEGGFVDVD